MPTPKHGRFAMYVPDVEKWAQFVADCKAKGVSPSSKLWAFVQRCLNAGAR